MDEIIFVDKPVGITSFGVVSKVRGMITRAVKGGEIEGKVPAEAKEKLEKIGKSLREEYLAKGETMPKKIKVGHAGTLDPFATGLLILLIGKGVKRAGEFLKLDKEYIAEIRLGAESDTGDPEGEVVEKVVEKIPSREEVEKVVRGFLGKQKQRVPKYAAVKINGERAYKLARKGKEVEMPEREIEIYEIEMLEYEWPRLVIRTKVSSGTYIRALGEDIGRELGVGAYLTGLRRTQIDKYRVEEAMEI